MVLAMFSLTKVGFEPTLIAYETSKLPITSLRLTVRKFFIYNNLH